MSARTITVGQRLRWDGEAWTVEALTAGMALLRRGRGRATTAVSIRELAVRAQASPRSAPADAIAPWLDTLDEVDCATVTGLLDDVREVLTGYRSGRPDDALPDEPRPAYSPGRPLMERYHAKAAERELSAVTVRRYCDRYRRDGAAGLVDGRHLRRHRRFGRVDPRWVDLARDVLAEHTTKSRQPRNLQLERINLRARQAPGDPIPAPSARTGRAVLAELSRGRNTLDGSTKGQRSIATRPATPYGRLRATRPGEYVLMDTTRLDVFAMDRKTLQWVQCELTVSMDLCTRCIVGLRLSPKSTQAVDGAIQLIEVMRADSVARTDSGLMPYAGVPTALVLPESRTDIGRGLPAVAPESLLVDHGRIYLSQHMLSVCERLGISIQLARPGQGSDKGPLERWFRTLREGLLAALPGYKGPDLYSRGESPEADAYYFIDELEDLLREWISTVYHETPHKGLAEPTAPNVDLSPREMFELAQARCGVLRIPDRADLVYDFLAVEWRTIQHYGVEAFGLRYDGAALNPYRGHTSPYTGVNAGLWPLRVDPDDISRVYFQDPDDRSWHELRWVDAARVPVPFSAEALAHARRLARRPGRHVDSAAALVELLDRWDSGLAATPAERRMAQRLAAQRARRLDADSPADPPTLADVLAEGVDALDLTAHDGDDDDLDNLDDFDDPAVESDEFYLTAYGRLA